MFTINKDFLINNSSSICALDSFLTIPLTLKNVSIDELAAGMLKSRKASKYRLGNLF